MQPLNDNYILAAYVDGADLDNVASTLKAAFDQFACSGVWPSPQVLVVDQRHLPDPNEPEYLPQWDMGLNLGLDHVTQVANWFDGVESLVRFLQQLATITLRDFELFLCTRSELWRQEHLLFVGSAPIDLAWLRKAIERLTKPTSIPQQD